MPPPGRDLSEMRLDLPCRGDGRATTLKTSLRDGRKNCKRPRRPHHRSTGPRRRQRPLWAGRLPRAISALPTFRSRPKRTVVKSSEKLKIQSSLANTAIGRISFGVRRPLRSLSRSTNSRSTSVNGLPAPYKGHACTK